VGAAADAERRARRRRGRAAQQSRSRCHARSQTALAQREQRGGVVQHKQHRGFVMKSVREGCVGERRAPRCVAVAANSGRFESASAPAAAAELQQEAGAAAARGSMHAGGIWRPVDGRRAVFEA